MDRTFEEAPSDLQMLLAELSVSTHETGLPVRLGEPVRQTTDRSKRLGANWHHMVLRQNHVKDDTPKQMQIGN